MLPLLTVGLALVGTLLFWSAVQNWLADLLHRAQARLGVLADALQSALVYLDRVVVNGRRAFVLTARAVFRNEQVDTPHLVEEMREIAPADLPTELRTRLERGETLEYELSLGSMKLVEKPKPNVTYRVVVRRAE
ncbi:MAG: hypothetical protein DYG88_14905 [Chloroflexi bacterium CFX4]|nr:hypothetical protein [Chloroflexi bacterium CFX4]